MSGPADRCKSTGQLACLYQLSSPMNFRCDSGKIKGKADANEVGERSRGAVLRTKELKARNPDRNPGRNLARNSPGIRQGIQQGAVGVIFAQAVAAQRELGKP